MQHTFVQHILPANSCIANELGERLYAKMTELVIPQIQEAISNIIASHTCIT